MSVIGVSYEGPDGSFWSLEGTGRDSEVMLTKVKGLTAQIERAVSARPGGVGVDINAFTYPDMQGTLSFVIYADGDHVRKGEVFRLFTDAWTTRYPGKLTVVNSISGIYSTDAYCAKTPDVTEFSPWSKDVQFVEFDIDVLSTDGVWQGQLREWSGVSVEVTNRGSLPLYPVIKWTGTGQSVVLPSGVSVSLPDAPVGSFYYLSMDPSVSFRVTDVGGEVVDAWSAMRGFPVYGTIEAGQTALFNLSSLVTLQTRELIENPWR